MWFIFRWYSCIAIFENPDKVSSMVLIGTQYAMPSNLQLIGEIILNLKERNSDV